MAGNDRIVERLREWGENDAESIAGPAVEPLLHDVRRAAARIEELEGALRPFADHADTWVVQTAALDGDMLTLTNGERMSGIAASAFCHASSILKKGQGNG